MLLYTIGFTQKSARQFFELLRKDGVQRLIDIRIHPNGQLAGFSRQEDLPYFLEELAKGCEYVYLPVLAPTAEIMKDARKDKDWLLFASRFEALMDARDIPAALDRSVFEEKTACLLCSEASPEHCHRRMVAERLARKWPVEIIHL